MTPSASARCDGTILLGRLRYGVEQTLTLSCSTRAALSHSMEIIQET